MENETTIDLSESQAAAFRVVVNRARALVASADETAAAMASPAPSHLGCAAEFEDLIESIDAFDAALEDTRDEADRMHEAIGERVNAALAKHQVQVDFAETLQLTETTQGLCEVIVALRGRVTALESALHNAGSPAARQEMQDFVRKGIQELIERSPSEAAARLHEMHAPGSAFTIGPAQSFGVDFAGLLRRVEGALGGGEGSGAIIVRRERGRTWLDAYCGSASVTHRQGPVVSGDTFPAAVAALAAALETWGKR